MPIIIIIGIYFINDPFKVLYHYDAYAPADGIAVVNINDDFASTETFLNNYKKYHYDSYIFGNSRAKTFHINEWEKHIPSTNCFQYGVSNESLYGIERKLAFLDEHGIVVRNALIVMDRFLYDRVAEDPKFPKHPLLSGRSMFQFQLNTFEGFFDVDFLNQYLYYLVTHKVKSSFFSGALNSTRYHYDVLSNDAIPTDIDANIDRDTAAYYNARKNVFYDRSVEQKYSDRIIGKEHVALFTKIKAYFDKYGTSYKIVISPVYDQVKTNPTDLSVIDSIFGQDNVYDLSGINSITNDKQNYYESAHYRMRISNGIMDSIYKKNQLAH